MFSRWMAALCVVALCAAAACDGGGEEDKSGQDGAVADKAAPAEAAKAPEKAEPEPPKDAPVPVPDPPKPKPKPVTCDDPDSPSRVACSLSDAGAVECCLVDGCVRDTPPLRAEAFSLIVESSGEVEMTAEQSGACLVMTPPELGEEDRVLGVSIDPEKLPVFGEEPLEVEESLKLFAQHQWWCPVENISACKSLVAPAEHLNLVVVHEGELLRSERRRSQKLAKHLARTLKTTVNTVFLANSGRGARLATWIHKTPSNERVLELMDEVVRHEGLTIVLRFPAPRVQRGRGKDQLFSRGILGAAMLIAPPGGGMREVFWTDAGISPIWDDEEVQWFVPMIGFAWERYKAGKIKVEQMQIEEAEEEEAEEEEEGLEDGGDEGEGGEDAEDTP